MKLTDPPLKSVAEAEDLLKWGVEQKTAVLNGLLTQKKIKLNQNQFDALTSFTYNVGVGGLMKSTLLKLIIVNPLDPKITEAFGMWNEITKNGKKVVCPDLTARRKREAALYFKPIV